MAEKKGQDQLNNIESNQKLDSLEEEIKTLKSMIQEIKTAVMSSDKNPKLTN